MRFPWPFRRTSADPEAATSAASAGPVGPGDPSGPSASSRSAAWRSLPALAETIGEPPLIAPAKPFRADLAGATLPPPILPPLTHGAGLEAPKGLVVGLAQPATRGSGGGSLPAPVQRSPIHPARSATSAAAAPPEAPPPTAPTSVAPATSGPVVAGAPDDTRRRLPVAEPPASNQRLDLTRAAIDLRPPGGLVRSPARSATPPMSPASPMTSTADRSVQRAAASPADPDPVPASATTARSVVPAAGEAPQPIARQRAAAVASAPDDVARLSIGQARRLGLGAPIAGGPVPSSSALGAAPRPQRAPALVGAPASPIGSSGPATMAVPSPSQRPASRPAAVAPAPVAPATAAPASSRGLSVAPATSPAWPGRSPGVQRAPIAPAAAPLTPARSLRGRIQRAPLTIDASRAVGGQEGEGGGPSGSTTVESTGGPVTVHRGEDASELSSAFQARSFTHQGEIYLPSSHGSLSSGPARSLLAHELTHVVQQRRLGLSLPSESSRPGQALEAEAVAAERGSSLPLAMPPQPGSKAEPSTLQPGALPQRAPEVPGAVAGAALPAAGNMTVHLATEVQRAPTRTGGGAVTPGSGSAARPKPTERELEDLARQLYARIGRRLRRDLLVDRERAGMAMDLS
ncbi:MAG TPA: DUF4157 domain-containing protein [Candidatus Limnocylindrales bacterium]|nr:DUF4157 domain-containing protein [Candidatus Limnocylindrales bacterium]